MRVLAVNDISCVGKCSLTVTLPIVSACGVTCDVLPTALLSTHTGGFEGYTFRDLTDDLQAVLRHWKSLGLRFDIVYSGYLGNAAQIDIVSQIKREFLQDNGLFVVDPVMGDGGRLYAGFSDGYVKKMRRLCREADYILPNLTEACYLADIPYPENGEPYPIERVFSALRGLCKRPVVTGLLEGKEISVCYADENGEMKKYSSENVEGFFHGAGDVFASARVGALARGKDERTAVTLAAELTTAAIRRSAAEVEDKRYGLDFEAEIFPFLKKLNG